MSTGIHHFLTAVVPVATAAFAWVQHGKTPLYNRGSRRHFPAQVRPEFGLNDFYLSEHYQMERAGWIRK
ncbi:hypothetical protein D9H93_23475 [Escherichia coli]|nr:hypothetical protein [Escherichia coli]